MIIESALLCLALNIYHEARGEPEAGQYAVAHVTVNRAMTEDRVCTEVFRRKQFSWTGSVSKTAAGWAIPRHMRPRHDNLIEQRAWWASIRIASNVLSGRAEDFTQGSKHYHASYVDPYWASSMKIAMTIGSHIFYSPNT